MGRKIRLGPLSGYLERPAGFGPWPTVIIIHEWWGLDNQTESIADRFAGIGYMAFAPDLFEGEFAKLGDSDKAASLVEKYAPGAPEKLGRVYDAIKDHMDCNGRIG